MRKRLKAHEITGNYQYRALRQGSSAQRQWHQNRHELLKFLSYFKPEDRVLDMGCGSGNIVLEFASEVKKITGIDNNDKCISFLTKKIAELGLLNAEAVKSDLINLKTRDTKYSKIVLTEVIEHFSIADAKTILVNTREALEPGGKLLVTTPNYQSLWPLIEMLIDKLKLTPKLWGEQHLTKYTLSKLTKIVSGAGFGIEQSGSLNFISPFMAPISSKLAKGLAQIEFRYIPFGSLLYLVACRHK